MDILYKYIIKCNEYFINQLNEFWNYADKIAINIITLSNANSVYKKQKIKFIKQINQYRLYQKKCKIQIWGFSNV